MKKILLVAMILLSVGVVLCGTGCAMMGFDFKNLSNDRYAVNTHTVEESFSKIDVDVDTTDIFLLPATDNVCKVECFEGEKRKHDVSVVDGVLQIVYQKNLKWYDYIQIYSPSMYVKVYLPQVEYEEISLNGDTADMEISKGIVCQNASLKGDTGDFLVKGSVKGKLSLATDTGDVCVEDVQVETLEIETDTGEVELSSVAAKNVQVNVNTGDVEMESVVFSESLRVESDTGDVEMAACIGGTLGVKTSTGDVQINGCDATSIEIQTSTGDVSGTLLTGKNFMVDTSTGKVRVPQDNGGGTCTIKTSTGDVNVWIEQN